ncbi:TonB-dependent receptor [Terriglobus tenax]|uniref:TonB-dependent receptor n=1 Tax=Terriglobus tenax TaxID=1111115 RepID=UPI0021DFFFA4|nr:TonB-dependent receptor [Terriglobus tenax]
MAFIRTRFQWLMGLLAVVALVSSTVLGQSNYGSIRGIVKDPQGAVIANSTVVLTDEATKIERQTVSNAAGEYSFSAVSPGVYTVRISSDGFSAAQNKGVRVEAGNTLTLDVALALGSSSQTVEVSAVEPLVDNGTSYGGQTIDSQKLTTLPNPGRNPFLFSKLDNSVTPVGDPRFVRFQDQSGSSTISIAGGPLSSNNYSVDGIPITDSTNRAVIIPSVESVEEVKIQSNTYDAEVGRTSGGMFNTTLKSGTSTLHGVLNGQTRQTNWGANLFFNNRTPLTDPITKAVLSPTTPRGAAEFYSYAGSLGGPIPLPRWLGGKDKTFFQITEEGYRQRSPYVSGNLFIVPTVKQRSGDFSEIGTVTGGVCVTGRCIYDPTSATRTPFEGNVIPTSRINTIGRNIINTYPTPNTSVTAYGANNFNGGDTLGDRADEFIGKLTHSFGSRWLADLYYMHYGSKEPGGNPLQNFAGSSGSYLLYRKVDAVGIQNTITLNPTTILTVGFGFNRFPNDTQDISAGYNQANLGFPSNYLGALSKTGFPAITGDAGMASEGTSNSGPAVFFSRNFVTGIAKSLGKHNIKAGYVFRVVSVTFTSLSNTSGAFTFDSTLTNSGGSTASSTGAAAASLLLGYPTTGTLVIPARLGFTTGYNSVYLQDDWRITSKLTVNAGIRYEHERGIHERDNKLAVGFDRAAQYSVGGVAAQGGVMFANQNGYGTTSGTTPNKISPRLGMAYQVDSKTVVRGGYGVFYQPIVYSNTAAYAPGYVVTNSIASQSGVPSISLSNPFPNLQTVASGNSQGLATSVGSTLTLIDQYRKAPFYQSFSASLERELPYGFAVKVGYIGGHGRNQQNTMNINQLPDQYYSLGSTVLNANQPFKYAGVGAWNSATRAYHQSLRPFAQYQGITMTVGNGATNYNALALKVQKRFNQGLTILTSFTWASNWDSIWSQTSTLNSGNTGPQDTYNPKAEYARSINDIPKRLTIAGTYELPFGRGKWIGGNVNKIVDLAIGGWKFNDVMIVQDGSPLAITQTNNLSPYGNTTQRPNRIASGCKSGRPQDRLNQYFDPSAWTALNAPSAGAAASSYYGNSTRTVDCYGPGYLNSDISLFKTFSIGEKVKAEFRAEALNAFNTPQFATPNRTIGGGSSTGQISGTLGFPRLVALGGRIQF